jgi:hypothetical protein
VQAIVPVVAREEPERLCSSFTGRVQAGSGPRGAHPDDDAKRSACVRNFFMLGISDDNRISCSGPVLLLDVQAAINLSLILHEPATNARKYGALSVPNGRLSVSWEMRTNGGSSLYLLWKESSGPKVTAPKTRGFGSTLIEHSLRGSGGEASTHYATDGVTCEIKLPLPEEARPTIGTFASAERITNPPAA